MRRILKIYRYFVSRYVKSRACTVGDRVILHNSSRIINSVDQKERIIVGSNSHIKGELLVYPHGGRIRIGEYCYIGEGTRVWSGSDITIGDRVLISHNVNIFDNKTHPLDPKLRHEQFREIISSGFPKDIDLSDKPVIIEDDVLIGTMSIILQGITIGRGSVVAAGSVVTRDVARYVVVAGNPAKVIRDISIYDESQS